MLNLFSWMQKQLDTWKFLKQGLESKLAVVLLYVLESNGSSPGRQGFFMGVDSNGNMEGSIGGGIMEHKFVELAIQQARLMGSGFKSRLEKQVHDKEEGANQSGMICSGEQTIFMYAVKYTELKVIDAIITSLELFKNGTLKLSDGGIEFENKIPPQNYLFDQDDKSWYYLEKTGYKNSLFIIGGGHCSLALSKLMRGMDYYITVFEEREGLNTLQRNEFAHEVIYVDDYAALTNLIPSGPAQFVVIMTFGYRTDDVAIRALLGKRFNYMGVLGSKNKIGKMFAEYKDEGIQADILDKIHAPIGVHINSQTPEEIAVSIAAEIIKVKNGFAT